MNKLISLFVVSIFSFSCTCLATNSEPESRLVGCYRSANESLYDWATLELFESNKYRIRTDGDVGSWGEIYGKWEFENNQVFLKPENKAKFQIQANPLVLYLSVNVSAQYLLFNADQKPNDYSASGWAPFEKQKCKL